MARRRRRADGGGFSLDRILDNPKTMTYVGLGAAALVAFIWWKSRQKSASAPPAGVGSVWDQATPAQRQAAMAAMRKKLGIPPQNGAQANGGAAGARTVQATVANAAGQSIADAEGLGVLGCDACEKGDDLSSVGSGDSMESMYD